MRRAHTQETALAITTWIMGHHWYWAVAAGTFTFSVRAQSDRWHCTNIRLSYVSSHLNASAILCVPSKIVVHLSEHQIELLKHFQSRAAFNVLRICHQHPPTGGAKQLRPRKSCCSVFELSHALFKLSLPALRSAGLSRRVSRWVFVVRAARVCVCVCACVRACFCAKRCRRQLSVSSSSSSLLCVVFSSVRRGPPTFSLQIAWPPHTPV